MSNDTDESTNQVIDWLNFFNKDFYRVNGDKFLQYKLVGELDSMNLDLVFRLQDNNDYKNGVFETDLCKVVWYRRWEIPKNFSQHLHTNSIEYQITRYSLSQFNALSKVFYHSLAHCDWLNHPSDLDKNKLYILGLARRAGLTVPHTMICTNKNELIDFKKRHKRIITKSIGEVSFFYNKERTYGIYTSEITWKDIDSGEDNFFPSLVQELIEKEYELRIFYLDKIFYTMAIFSQTNSQTSIDFRRYDHKKPNRSVPYLLPSTIQKKLLALMGKLNMNSGSIDMIKDITGKYVFLEVNPIGQFGMVSMPCNYHLEKRISEALIKMTI